MMNKIWRLLACLGWLAVSSPNGAAQVATLTPAADTSLLEANPDFNLGATQSLPAGVHLKGTRSRLLVRFDVAGVVPPGATITAVTLKLAVTASGGVNSRFSLHRLLRSWGEGIGSGNTGQAAGVGEATWESRLAGSALWSTPGAAAPADFTAGASASQVLGQPGEYVFPSTANLVADAQTWLGTPAVNFGWLLLCDDDTTPGSAKRIASREATAGAPVLTVEYVAPFPPPRIERIERAGDEVRVHFHLVEGKLYAVEYVDSLPSTNWTFLANAASKFFPTNTVVADSLRAGPRRFYRVGIVGDID